MAIKNYKKYLLVVLVVIQSFNYIDRHALGLLLQEIKVDLDLSDTQLGFLSGIAFAVFYSVMGIPIARWADRGDRVSVIAITTALWSVTVAACGLVGNFVQLLMVRIGVAVGEAGCFPPAHSLIADFFSREERPRAVAFYMLGGPLSIIFGFFLAGWLNEIYGWRVTFALLGLPGLGLAVLAWFTLREPRRLGRGTRNFPSPCSDSLAPHSAEGSQMTLKEVGRNLWSNRTFCHLLLGFSIALFFSYGIWQWQPTFFIRSHGLETGELGTWFAAIWGVGGLVGTYWGGELACRRATNNEPLQLKAMALVYCGFGVVAAGSYVSPNLYLAFALMGLAAVGVATTYGPLFATIQLLVPPPMRAMSIATVYLFANFIGMGLGPLATGALSDLYQSWAGEESLRYALLTLCPGYMWAGWHLWRGASTVAQDLKLQGGVAMSDSDASEAGPRQVGPSGMNEIA